MTVDKNQLPLFERNQVHRATVRIVKAGDGLSEALTIDPVALQLDEEVFYVLRGKVSQINHARSRDGIVTRVHTVDAAAITECDGELAGKLLQAAAEEITRRKDEAAGQLRLDEERAAAEREQADKVTQIGSKTSGRK
jgi:hypothetical protein